MSKLTDRVSFLKGLAEGLDLDTDKKEGKLLAAIIDVLDDIAVEIEDIETACDDMSDQLDAVDEDLSEIEENIYDECDCDCDDEDCDCCDCEDDEVYEVECPECHDVIYLDEEMLLEGGIACPNCGTDLEFDFDCCEDDCDCGCGCGCEDADEQ